MILGIELEQQVYDLEHIQRVLAEIADNFPAYFASFARVPLDAIFREHLEAYKKEQEAYWDYLDIAALDEYESDPNAFKGITRKRCPIIRRCLMSQDEVMKEYKKDFNLVSGRQLLDGVRSISEFGRSYVAEFNDEAHEKAATPDDLGLNILNEEGYFVRKVIGYGIQSSLLYGQYPREFAHRSQNAVWALYFLSGRKDFGLEGGSEFLMVRPELGTCEQNYFYPAQLFGFYSLRVYLTLRAACEGLGVELLNRYRYIYLSAFSDHVADQHREDINTYKRSSEYVESQPWF